MFSSIPTASELRLSHLTKLVASFIPRLLQKSLTFQLDRHQVRLEPLPAESWNEL
jgi:hypothetical protein